MSATMTVTRQANINSKTYSAAIVVTADADIDFSVIVPTGSTNKNYVLPFPVTSSRLQALFILSKGALTIKTNSSGSPANTIAVPAPPSGAAASAISWLAADGTTAPLTTDVTSLYITNATGVDVQLDLKALYNAA